MFRQLPFIKSDDGIFELEFIETRRKGLEVIIIFQYDQNFVNFGYFLCSMPTMQCQESVKIGFPLINKSFDNFEMLQVAILDAIRKKKSSSEQKRTFNSL